MKRLEINVPYLSSSDKTGITKNKVLGIDTSCNIFDASNDTFTYKSKITYLRTFENSKSTLNSSEQVKAIKNKCTYIQPAISGSTTGVIKKIADCSNITYEESKYTIKP